MAGAAFLESKKYPQNIVVSCRRSGPLACIKTKHDQIVRRLAQVSNISGRRGRYHDGPIFTFGRKSRPADLLQDHVNMARFPEGECVDFTAGLVSVRSADALQSATCHAIKSEPRHGPHRLRRQNIASDLISSPQPDE